MSRTRNEAILHVKEPLGQLWVTANGGSSWQQSTSYWFDPAMTNRPYQQLDRCADEIHPGPPYRTGGPLNVFHFTDDTEIKHHSVYTRMISPMNGYRYIGGFYTLYQMHNGDPSYTANNLALEYNLDPSSPLRDWGDPSPYGAGAYHRFKPGNPVAEAAVFLAELKDVPRMLRTTAKGFHELWRSAGGSLHGFRPKRVADHWLNTQFGWFPFLNDLRKFRKAYKRLNSLLGWIARHNGHWLKRGGVVRNVVSSESVAGSTTITGHRPTLPTYFYASPTISGNYNIVLRKVDNVWFEARYRYWIPDLGSDYWKARAVAAIFGLRPTPSVIWEATPWSWLVDWFSNAGDVIANLDSGYAENLATKYAYIMGHYTHDVFVSSMCNLHSTCGGRLIDSWSFSCDKKMRVKASPFGFGLTNSDLTARQWSILAALGITRW